MPEAVRAIALALPGVVEQSHHGFPSFRVRGRIFATLPSDTTVNVMLGERGIRAMAASSPGVCTERWWGRRLAALTIALPLVDEALVRDVLTDAWEGKAGRAPRSVP
jgi:hypothetical protein